MRDSRSHADAGFFRFLEGLIRSLRDNGPPHGYELCVIDVGLEPGQRAWAATHSDRTSSFVTVFLLATVSRVTARIEEPSQEKVKDAGAVGGRKLFHAQYMD